MIERCHTIAPFGSPYCSGDSTGCLKQDAHNDSHISITTDNRIIEWEDDYSCKCGCWDEYSAGSDEVCRVYSYLTIDVALEKISEKYNGKIPDDVLELLNQLTNLK